MFFFFFFQAEDGIRDKLVTGVQTCALPISRRRRRGRCPGRRSWQAHNGCNGPGRQVIEVTLGADRAWWSDWSSKPAGVLLDLGRFDSYTLPPRSVLFVSHLRDRAAGNLRQSLSPSARHLLRPVALPLR